MISTKQQLANWINRYPNSPEAGIMASALFEIDHIETGGNLPPAIKPAQLENLIERLQERAGMLDMGNTASENNAALMREAARTLMYVVEFNRTANKTETPA